MYSSYRKRIEKAMTTQERWNEITRLQCEIDNELQHNPASAFWQRANALLQLFKYSALALERTDQIHTRNAGQKAA